MTLGRGISTDILKCKPGFLSPTDAGAPTGKGDGLCGGSTEAVEDKCQAWPFGLGHSWLSPAKAPCWGSLLGLSVMKGFSLPSGSFGALGSDFDWLARVRTPEIRTAALLPGLGVPVSRGGANFL